MSLSFSSSSSLCYIFYPLVVFTYNCCFCYAYFFHFQASEDAKKLVDEERAFARSEIESARAAVQRVEEALQEQERISRASGKQVMQAWGFESILNVKWMKYILVKCNTYYQRCNCTLRLYKYQTQPIYAGQSFENKKTQKAILFNLED